jgi:RHS repeat-associated protein
LGKVETVRGIAISVEAQVTPGPRTISYDFDAVGNRSVLVDPDAGRTTYSYDGRRLLSYLVNPYGERTTWQYDVAGRATTMTHGNASIAETDYDAAGRIAAVRNLKSDSSVLSIFTYAYDASGNRTGVQEANGDRVTWSYDALNQLIREARSGSNSYDVTFSYDAAGNRLTKVEGGTTTTYSYDAANQLNVEVTPSTRTTYTYDASGNTATINAGGQLTTYAWDIEDHITGVQLPGAGRNTFSYDGNGKRRRMEESASARDLLWDGENVLREQEGASLVAQYTHAPERYGALVSQRRSGATSFHHFDALGSTERLTDSSQAALISYLYRAFGEQSILSGSHANPLTWVGQLGYYRQGESGEYWLRARVYRPTAGRFVSRDPVCQPDLPNLYIWPGQSPVILGDPSGLQRTGSPVRGSYSRGPKAADPSAWTDSQSARRPQPGEPGYQTAPAGLADPYTYPCQKDRSSEGIWWTYTLNFGQEGVRPPYIAAPQHEPPVCMDPKKRWEFKVCCRFQLYPFYLEKLAEKCDRCFQCCKDDKLGLGRNEFAKCMRECMSRAPKAVCKVNIDARAAYMRAIEACKSERDK